MTEEETRTSLQDTQAPSARLLSDQFDAVVFDLDGVITDTASLHFDAWKEAFDEILDTQGDRLPFRHEEYLEFVDGKSRDEGIRSFLASRNYLHKVTPKERKKIAQKKNDHFQELLRQGRAEALPGAIDLVEQLLFQGIKTALVSSSKNASAVLESLSLEYLFDEQVDGTTLEALEMEGKPAPDLFLEAIWRLGVRPDRAAVIEDAQSGVAAGRAAGVALVIGVASTPRQAQALLREGADLTVANLYELLTFH